MCSGETFSSISLRDTRTLF